MSAQHPSVMPADPGADRPVPGRFVSLRLPARGPAASTAAAGEVVLARLDDDLRPDTVVLARSADLRTDRHDDVCDDLRADVEAFEALEVRRVGRVTAESVELLPLDEALPPRVVPRAGDAVVGTVVLRWSAV